MQPVERVSGKALPLGYSDVDTDQIVPSDALKRIERTGFGQFLFSEWREDPDFVMNKAEHEGAVILLAGENFGSGSSREHAPWALQDYGFRAIIAPSYADIFNNNCYQNGVLPVVLPEATVNEILSRAKERPGYSLTVDLEKQTVEDEEGELARFEVDPFRRDCLLRGLDGIGLTMEQEEDIARYEQGRSPLLPVAEGAAR
jgi:3-isopropylmalate/(R)-2-methylmalate dehydratase small subunit